MHTWIKRHIAVRRRLGRICTAYLLFLMVATTKHSLEEAARFSGLHPSLFSKLLKSHSNVAITTLDQLSKTQARKIAKALERVRGLPWKILLIIDAPSNTEPVSTRKTPKPSTTARATSSAISGPTSSSF